MAELEKLDPLDAAARSSAARVLREALLYTDKDGHPIVLSNATELEKSTDWDAIFSAEAELISKLRPEALKRRAPLVYERYADVVGPAKAARRAANALDLGTCEPEDLRADLLQVQNETARHYMINFQVERERTRLTWLVVSLGAAALLGFVGFIGWPFLERDYGPRQAGFIEAGLLLLVVAGVLAYRWLRRRWSRTVTVAALLLVAVTFTVDVRAQVQPPTATATTQQEKALSDLPIVPLVLFAGILGAAFSILQRVQRSTAADPLVALFNLRTARSQIYLSIVSGAIASLVVFAVFSGGMLEGALFPKIVNANTADNCKGMMKLVRYLQGTGPCSHTDYGKLLVWAFIAGFAERFVPDILDKFTASANKP